MYTKICTSCKEEKDINNFSWHTKAKQIKRAQCKACSSEYGKKYRYNRKISIKYEENKKLIPALKTCNRCQKEQEITNFYYKEERQNYHTICKFCLLGDRKNRKEEIRQYIKLYRKKPEIKLRHNLQTRLYDLVKTENKSSNTLKKYIGCSYNFFLEWIERQFYDGMTMKNYGKVWHIDHCTPCSDFDFNNEKEIKKCFNWKNLRPLLKVKNLSKKDKIIYHDILMQELKSSFFEKLNL